MVRSPLFDKKYLKKAGRHIVVNITIKLKTAVRKPWIIKIIKLRVSNSDWRNVVLNYDTRPHSVRIRQEKILDLVWSVLFHSPYTPDLIPSDFYLFSSLQNALNDKIFLKKTRRKRLRKTYWAQNQANFTGEKSTSELVRGKRRFKIMASILWTEINSLLNYSWINNI